MLYLIIVSIIWAFSFGVIKFYLADMDSNFISLFRLLISSAVFLPFLRLKGLTLNLVFKLLLIGSIQYGIMYIAYTRSFEYLHAYQTALFTIFTPLFVVIIYDIYKRSFGKYFHLSAFIAVAGSLIITYNGLADENYILGFLLIQISNIAFAYGQVRYKLLFEKGLSVEPVKIFALLYLGGTLTAFLGTLFFSNYLTLSISTEQSLSLLYLGVVASGASFFLWNQGTLKTNSGVLAAMNNLKIPLGVLASIIVFGERADLLRLLLGSIILLAAVAISLYFPTKEKTR